MPQSCLSASVRIRPVHLGARRPSLTAGVLVTLLLGLAACGSDTGSDEPEPPSRAALDCREKWSDLEPKVQEPDATSTPSDLASRWNSVSATVAHYSGAAGSKDCGETLEEQEEAIDALAAFGDRVAPFDMEARLDQVRSGAQEYAAAPRPTPPSPSPAKGKKPAKAPRNTAPRPAAVAAALKVLTEQAPLASEQQAPGWRQAGAIDLGDPAAVAKALKDLAFLSSQSEAYLACTTALTTIQAAALAAAAAD